MGLVASGKVLDYVSSGQLRTYGRMSLGPGHEPTYRMQQKTVPHSITVDPQHQDRRYRDRVLGACLNQPLATNPPNTKYAMARA